MIKINTLKVLFKAIFIKKEVISVNYSKNFKKTIINLYNNGNTITNIIKQYNIPKSTVYDWIKPIANKRNNKQLQICHIDYKNLKNEFNSLKLEFDLMT